MRPRAAGRLEWAAVMAILALAAFLRFGWPGVNSFAFDEARLSLISLAMAREGELATLGMPSSAGVPNLPGAAWVFALPYVVSPDPMVATWFVSLLSVLTVLIVWALVRHAWGPWAAIIAALYLAASPFAVLYGRSIWAQNLLPPLAAAWAGLAYLAVARGKRWALAGHLFLAGFAFQVHFAGAGLALGSLYFLVRFRWWRFALPVLAGAGLALASLAPGILAILSRPELGRQFRAALGNGAAVDLQAGQELVRLALGREWQYLAAGTLGSENSLLVVLVAALLLAGMVGALRVLLRGGRGPANGERDNRRLLAEMGVVWLLVTPLFFLRHSTPVFIHYVLPSLPAIGLVAGAAALALPGTIWRLGACALAAVIAAGWSVGIGHSLDLAGRVETPNGLSTPLGLLRAAAYSVPQDRPVLLFTHGDDPNLDGEAAIFEALWWERPHRILQGENLLVLPPYPAFLMASLAPFQAWEELRDAELAGDVLTFARREGADPFVGTYYDGEAEPEGFTPVSPVALADGTVLEGWRARRVGPRLRVSTLWRATEGPIPAGLQQLHHLRTEETLDGQPLMVSDVPLSGRSWRAGDRVIVMADFFDVPPGEYRVDVGHYTLPEVRRVPRVDNEGDVVRLGPFQVAAQEE